MIMKLMEGDYDPEKFERVMASAYGEDYYQAEEEVWKTEKDAQRDLIVTGHMCDDIVGHEEAEEEEIGEAALDQEEEVQEDGDADEDEDRYYADDYPKGGGDTGNNAAQHPKVMDQKLQSKIQDELYKLDYEDIIGDMPTRFKYRTVTQNDYGLSTEEILFSRDSTLKQFVSLKRMAPYIRKEEEFRPGSKQRKRFRKMIKTEKESEEREREQEAQTSKRVTNGAGKEIDGNNAADGSGGASKKTRRRQKKGRNKVEDIKDGIGSNIDTATAAAKEESKIIPNREEEESGTKRRRRKKKKGRVEAAHTENTGALSIEPSSKEEDRSTHNSTDGMTTKQSIKSKKERAAKSDCSATAAEAKKQRKKKKKQKHMVEGVSGARLAAYGI